MYKHETPDESNLSSSDVSLAKNDTDMQSRTNSRIPCSTSASSTTSERSEGTTARSVLNTGIGVDGNGLPGQSREVICGSAEGPMSICQRPGCTSRGKGYYATGLLKSACIYRCIGGVHVREGRGQDCICASCAARGTFNELTMDEWA